MRRVGDALMWLGAGVGTVVGLGLMLGIALPGVPWLFAVGLVKLTLLGALGMIGGGAILRRLALRGEMRDRLDADVPSPPQRLND